MSIASYYRVTDIPYIYIYIYNSHMDVPFMWGSGLAQARPNYTIYNEKHFSDDYFAFFYKFRRPTVGQNFSVVCINKGDHRDANSAKRHPAARFKRPAEQSTEPRAK